MESQGPAAPLVYILGLAPTVEADKQHAPFAGHLQRMLENSPLNKLKGKVSYGNIIQCHAELKVITQAEIECCRKRIIADIEKLKPRVVAGLGARILFWATGINSRNVVNDQWRGRPVIARFGTHTCWFLPLLDPDIVLDRDDEFRLVFDNDLRGMSELCKQPAPQFYTSDFDKGVTVITGTMADDVKLVEAALNRLKLLPKVGLDYETSGLRPYTKDSKIYTVAIGTFDDVIAFPLDHPDGWSERNRKYIWELFREFLLSSGRKIAHHVAFEQEWTAYHLGSRILRLTEWEDTFALAHTLHEDPGTHNLNVLCREHFGFFLKEKTNIDTKRLLEYPLKDVLRYNGMDTKWTYKLEEVLHPIVNSVKEYRHEYERKLRLASALVLMQRKGVVVDFAYAEKMQSTLRGEISTIERKLASCTEIKEYLKKFGRFEPTNPDAVLKLMRDICRRKEIDKVGGGVTTDEEALSKIPEQEVPSALLILEHRAVSKCLSTYIDPIITRKIVYPDGKIHSSFNSMIAVTGRLSADDPNLQNFPIRKRKEVRGVIAAPLGQWLVPVDYAQIEARVIAMASEDKNLVKYMWSGYDIHSAWATTLYKMYPDVADWIWDEFKIERDTPTFMKTLRQEMKNKWVFPQFFGSFPHSCARSLHIPNSVAEDLAAMFWDEFAGVKKWQNKLLKGYERNLYVETLGGRRRRGTMSPNEIINTPVQGTAADIVTEAMCALSERAEIDDQPALQCSLNVHDDLTFFIEDDTLESTIDTIAYEMCKPRADYIIVPLVVDVSIGERWHTKVEYKTYSSQELFPA